MNKRQKKKFKKKGYHRKCLGRDECILLGIRFKRFQLRPVNKSEITPIPPKPLIMTGTVFSGQKYSRYDYRLLTKEGGINEQETEEEIRKEE